MSLLRTCFVSTCDDENVDCVYSCPTPCYHFIVKLRTIRDFDFTNKTVLYRSPYDIATEVINGERMLVDDSRIKATIPTLTYLLEQNAKIVIITYVGRPDGVVNENLTTAPHAKRLSELILRPVPKLDDCIGLEVRDYISKMKAGELVMLENTRFHPEDKKDDDVFAKELAANGEVVVFDGFPQAHRIHASTTGILRHLPSYAGLYFESEVRTLNGLIESPRHPFTVIIGGAKISDKVEAVQNLMGKADMFLVGGGVANVFMKAEGKNMGDSFMEDVYVDEKRGEKKDWVELAGTIQGMRKNENRQLETLYKIGSDYSLHPVQHPIDLRISNSLSSNSEVRTVRSYKVVDVIPEGWMALDIGPESEEMFARLIYHSGTVFWNGPMGKFEDERFANGSYAIAKAMAQSDATTVIGGGDTIAVAKQVVDISSFTHASLAGGATLDFLAGKELPVLEMLTLD